MDDRRDHWLQRSVSLFLQAIIVGLAVWIGASVEQLRETSALNTYKITQIQATTSQLPTLAQQLAQLQFQVERLNADQAKDNRFRATHGGNP